MSIGRTRSSASRRLISAARAFIIASAIAAPLLPIDSGAASAVIGDGTLDPTPGGGATLTVGLAVSDPGSGVVYTQGGGSPSPVRYIAVPATEGEGLSLTYLCAADATTVEPGEIPWGWVYIVIGYDTLTGAEISRTTECVPITDSANPTVPSPPAVPTPPSIVEIWEHIALSAPEVHVNPDGEGVTGLATWIWTGGPTTATVDATIGEWAVTGTAHLAAGNIDPGDSTGTHDSAIPGSPDDHALDHTYETKGIYPLAITAVWTAEVTITGPALPATPVPIGTAALTTTRQYQVVEVVPVLLP